MNDGYVTNKWWRERQSYGGGDAHHRFPPLPSFPNVKFIFALTHIDFETLYKAPGGHRQGLGCPKKSGPQKILIGHFVHLATKSLKNANPQPNYGPHPGQGGYGYPSQPYPQQGGYGGYPQQPQNQPQVVYVERQEQPRRSDNCCLWALLACCCGCCLAECCD
uniref:Cysteine-rich transmembrane CYSTM domain-containing protein n=1 Tax=Globodera rostochiensis TaxID=31243 RepID=A0A914I3C3_GLORO